MKVSLDLADELVAWIQARGEEQQNFVQQLVDDDARVQAMLQQRTLKDEVLAREFHPEP